LAFKHFELFGPSAFSAKSRSLMWKNVGLFIYGAVKLLCHLLIKLIEFNGF